MQVRGSSLDRMLGKDYASQNCSIARALEVVGERWTLLIMRDAFLGVTRFDRFARKLGIGESTLTRRLATLCNAGVMEKRPYQPNRYDYVLTDRGRALFPVIHGLMSWGDENFSPGGPPVLTRHAGCGGVLERGARCATCGELVGPDDVEWRWGPGSGRAEARIDARPARGDLRG